MSRIASRGPMGLKAEKVPKDPDYLAKVRSLPCIICEEFDMVQTSPTTAHHPIHDRFSTRKTPDFMALPLCEGHHQGLRDTSKIAIHQEPSKWKRLYGSDHEYVARIQDMLDGSVVRVKE